MFLIALPLSPGQVESSSRDLVRTFWAQNTSLTYLSGNAALNLASKESISPQVSEDPWSLRPEKKYAIFVVRKDQSVKTGQLKGQKIYLWKVKQLFYFFNCILPNYVVSWNHQRVLKK